MRNGIVARATTFTACFILCLAGFAGCQEPKISGSDLEYVTAEEAARFARSTGGVLGIGSRSTLWIDPRGGNAFDEEHIPDAIHLPLNEVVRNDQRLADFNAFIVYGDDYNSPIAEAMSKRLLFYGYSSVRTLQGGLRAWKDAGYEVE